MKQYKYTINGNQYVIAINRVENNIAEVEVNGTPYKVEMEKPVTRQVVTLKRPAQVSTPATRPQPASAPIPTASAAPKAAGTIQAPLPGVILQIACHVGDAVKKGQTLIVLEAMKMENSIVADRDGKVIEIKVNKGDSVLDGADLLVIG